MPPLKRMSINVDADDLALIKEIAACRGVPEAQLIREGIHLAALSKRIWDGPFDWPSFEGTGELATSDKITEAVGREDSAR